MASFRISDEELARRDARFEAVKIEFQICKQKLDSKCEALLILSQELNQCRSERDQFKLMAEQLRERYQALKKQLMGKMPPLDSDNDVHHSVKPQDMAFVLVETREQNKSLQFEVEDLKQKFHDAQGDIKLLREQIARQRVGTTDEGMNTRHFPAHERENLVKQLEAVKEECTQLERDLQQVIDEKEELVTERDVYKNKYERLNQELNYILKGDEKRVVDIDALVMENKYLQDRLKQMEEEKSMAMATVSKYKTLLERKKIKSSLKLGQSRGGGLVITQKQVSQVLEDKAGMSPTPQAMADMQSLAGALLETVNDKNLALSHQRKTNKILGSRVSELEKKIKTLEVAGLWNIPLGSAASLEKLKAECEEVKTLVPQLSEELSSVKKDSEKQEQEFIDDLEAEFCSPSPGNSAVTSPTHNAHSSSPPLDDATVSQYFNSLELSPRRKSNKEITETLIQRLQESSQKDTMSLAKEYTTYAMEDLDLLPTKEELVKCVEEDTGVKYDTDNIERTELVENTDSCDEEPACDKVIPNVDAETAEKLEHLMENMTTKMIECSHKTKDKDHDKQNIDSDIYIQSGESKADDCNSLSPTDDLPLLPDGEVPHHSLLTGEDTGNIEV